MVKTRYLFRPPVREYDVIPIGMGGLRQTKIGEMSTLFALVRSGPGSPTTLKRIVFLGDSARESRSITLFAKYRVKLGTFSSGDLRADSRSIFEDPTPINLDKRELLKYLSIKIIPISEAEKHLSRTDSSGYTDPLDWKAIKGIIIRVFKGNRPDGTPYGVYTVVDESVGTEPKVSADGKVLTPGFTVWIAPELMEYDTESECIFVGTIQKREGKEPFMNCYMVIPLFVRSV